MCELNTQIYEVPVHEQCTWLAKTKADVTSNMQQPHSLSFKFPHLP